MTREEYMKLVDEARKRQKGAQLQNLMQLGTDFGGGVADLLGTLGSSMVATPIAGIGGLVTARHGLDASANTVRGTQDALTYRPDAGSAGSQALESIGALIPDFGGMAGGAVFDATGSPGLATGVETAINAIPELIPQGAALKAVQRLGGGRLPDVAAGRGPAASQVGAAHLMPPGVAPEKRLGEGGGNPGTTPPVTRSTTRFRQGRERSEFPGIYGDPLALVQAPRVAPESPLLGELFDTSRKELSEIALTRQSANESWVPEATKHGRDNAAAQRIMTPSNERRLTDAWDAARDYRPDLFEGMTGWYVSDPMYQRMLQLGMSPQEAAAEFARRETLIGMASPGSDVVTELNRGSRAAVLEKEGDLQSFLDYAGNPQTPRPGQNSSGGAFSMDPRMKGLLGHAYHSTSQGPPMMNYSQTGSMGAAAKVPSYIMAYRPTAMDFQHHFPVGDAHWSRMAGLADVRTNKSYAQSASIQEMRDLAAWYDNLARQHGLRGVPGQALHWGLFGPQTGVQTAVGAPKLELTADAIGRQAQRQGKDTKRGRAEVRDAYLRGHGAIGSIDPRLAVGMGAASAAGTGLAELWANTEANR